MAAVSEVPLEDRVRVDVRPVVSAHARLRVLRERLEEMLGRLVAHDMEGEPETLLLVEEFRVVVVTHFDREEESGVLEQAADHQPKFAGHVEVLIGEHVKMRRLIDVLCDDAPGPSWSDFELRFDAFCRKLGAHEQAENEVLMGAYLDDLGGHN